MRKGSGTPTASMQMSIGKAHQPKKQPIATDHTCWRAPQLSYTCRWAPQLSWAIKEVLSPPTRLVHDRYGQADVERQRHCEKGQHVQGRVAIDLFLCPVEQRDRYSRKLEEEQPHSQQRTGQGQCARASSLAHVRWHADVSVAPRRADALGRRRGVATRVERADVQWKEDSVAAFLTYTYSVQEKSRRK